VRVEFAQFGAVGLGRLEGTMRRIARTPRHVAADPSDMLCLALNRGPSSIACFQRGRDVVLNPGTATLVTNSHASDVVAKADNACFTVSMPRDRLADFVADVEDLVARPLDPGNAALRHLRRYIEILTGPDGLGNDPALNEHVGTSLLDLVALALGAGRDAAQTARMRGQRAARVQEIVAEIRARFADPAFTPHQAARKIGLSARALQNLLQETGSTFTERVMELRLQKARAILANPRHNGIKIGDIAFACGFNEASYFDRRFRARFGASPTQFRGRNADED
jgi:AraC-like DNA-binding protein